MMASQNDGLLKLLLALSANPTYAGARDKLYEAVSNEDLDSLIQACLAANAERKARENILSHLLDVTAQHGKDSTDTHLVRTCAASAVVSEDKRKHTPDNGIAETSSGHAVDDGDPSKTRTDVGAHKRSRHTRPHPRVVDISGDEDGKLTDGKLVPAVEIVQSSMDSQSGRGLWFLVRDTISGRDNWKFANEAPPEFLMALRARFLAQYDLNPAQFLALLNSMNKENMKHGVVFCINSYKGGKASKSCTFIESDGRQLKACDLCIRTKRLCARVMDCHGTLNLAFYPLPSAHQQARKWTAMGFWMNLK